MVSLLDRFRQTSEEARTKRPCCATRTPRGIKRDWSTAAALYKQYLELAPDHCAIWVQLGHVLKDDKKFGPAIEAYKHALTLDPNDFDIYVNLGHAHKDDKNVGLAIEAYKHALTLNPNDFDIYVNLGHAYKVAGDIDSAHQAYRKALELNPACTDARREIGDLIVDRPGRAGGRGSRRVRCGRSIWTSRISSNTRKHNNTLSGIQRVVANLILEARQYEARIGIRISCLSNQNMISRKFIDSRSRDRRCYLLPPMQSGGKSRDEIDEGMRAVYAHADASSSRSPATTSPWRARFGFTRTMTR